MDFYISREPRDAGPGEQPPEIPEGLRRRYGVGGSGPDQPRPAPYRPDALRIPRSVDRTLVERSLAEINLRLAEPSDPADPPVVVRLEPLDPAGGRVDAWQALGHLRHAAAQAGGDLRTAVGTPDPVGLEHLLFVGVGPVPWDSHPWDSHPWDSHPWDSHPWDSHGMFNADSYIRNARGGPVPVSVAFRPASPRPVVAGTGFDRRPVIAVLDTGIAGHDWFGTVGPEGGLPEGGFISELTDVQDAIRTSSRASGIADRHIEDVWDRDVLTDALTGVLSRHAGHGTFIAGVIQQTAPESEVAMARIMAGDGVAYESDLLAALKALVKRVERAQSGSPGDMVDILALSMGYYIEDEKDKEETVEFTELLNQLADLGVLVVAAAGNNSTMREFYPAALATTPPEGGGQAVISVGALNPNGTKAFFSNQARWVRAWATGASVVSTYPKLRGSMGPTAVLADLGRESMDPDDFTSGFAVWHGTSFAAPHAAAVLATKLVDAADHSARAMSDVSKDAMFERARHAVEACTRQEKD